MVSLLCKTSNFCLWEPETCCKTFLLNTWPIEKKATSTVYYANVTQIALRDCSLTLVLSHVKLITSLHVLLDRDLHAKTKQREILGGAI